MFLPKQDQPGDPKAARAAGFEGSWLNHGCGVGVCSKFSGEMKMRERESREKEDGREKRERENSESHLENSSVEKIKHI